MQSKVSVEFSISTGLEFSCTSLAGRACKAGRLEKGSAKILLNLKAEGLNNYGRSLPLGFLMCSIAEDNLRGSTVLPAASKPRTQQE
jgi:hypothetical protein